MKIGAFLSLFAICLTSTLRAEPPVVFVVRHAERADSGQMSSAADKDPSLSKVGFARAEALARVLRDAKIRAIYATEFRRTRQTAEPLAQRLHVQIAVVPAKQTSALIAKLKKENGNVLVVGHSNTVPEIIKGLGIAAPVTIAENDYDNLFLIMSGSRPRLVHLHYQ